MQAVEATTLSDIPRESIKGITWVSLRGRVYQLKSASQIDYWLRHFGSAVVEPIGRNWHTVEPSVPYRCFEVFIK